MTVVVVMTVVAAVVVATVVVVVVKVWLYLPEWMYSKSQPIASLKHLFAS
jgi:hypothetical protein